MADETTTTTLDDLTQSAKAEARMTLSQTPLLSDFVTKRPLPPGHDAVDYPLYGSLLHASVAEATDLANQAVSTSQITITPGEYGSLATVTKKAILDSQAQVGADIGRLFADAYRDSVNQAIYALFDGFGTAVGSSNTDLTEAVIASAVRQLRVNKAPPPYYLVVTPHVEEDLLGLYSATSNINAELLTQSQVTGILPMIQGVIPIRIDNLASGSGTGGIDEADTKTAIFSRAALGMVSEWDFLIETDPDISLRATEIVATSSWGVGEINDKFGIEVLVDNKD